MSTAIEKLHALREWVRDGIPSKIDQPGGAVLLGIEAAAILEDLDYLEGYILNLEAENRHPGSGA